jgi:hypothetical protein
MPGRPPADLTNAQQFDRFFMAFYGLKTWLISRNLPAFSLSIEVAETEGPSVSRAAL